MPLEDWIFLAVLLLVVVIFTGPGLWSESTEFPLTRIWRSFRERRKKPR